ncbi:hypothetical protein MBT84_07925 [Streptomyces sp. MBT84]|nr:hypothetical protein [Streptomyces sp. MBT84]MBW8699515.1 hypothetical protein [Streptomyces sp. MBT84]
MASAHTRPDCQLQALIAGSTTGRSGRRGTRRPGPSERTTCAADALSKG